MRRLSLVVALTLPMFAHAADTDRAREQTLGKKQQTSLDASLAELNELADLLARVALLAAGYHQHDRGKWRKRRGDRTEVG